MRIPAETVRAIYLSPDEDKVAARAHGVQHNSVQRIRARVAYRAETEAIGPPGRRRHRPLRRFTLAEDAVIERMRIEGHSLSTIAKAFNPPRTKGAVAMRLRSLAARDDGA